MAATARVYRLDLTGYAPGPSTARVYRLDLSASGVAVPDPVTLTFPPAAFTVHAGGLLAAATESIGDVTVSPAAATLTYTGGTPAVFVGQTVIVSPAAASLVYTGGTPTVTTGGNVYAAPEPAVLTYTGGTPVVIATAIGGGYVLRFDDNYVLRKL
jgi:hypothetical protein